MSDIEHLVSQRERLWDSHPIVTQSAILPTLPIQHAVRLVLEASRKTRSSLAFWADPMTGKSFCLRRIEATVRDRIPGCGVLVLEAVEDRQAAEGRLLIQILKAIKYAPKTEKSLAGKRDQVDRALIALSGKPEHLFILIDEAQEFSNAEFAWLKAVINGLTKNRVKVTTVLFGQRELVNRREDLYSNARSDLGERFMKKLVKFDGCCTAEDLLTILEAIDDKSSFPASSGWTYTQLLFPRAYANGFRFKNLANEMWAAFAAKVPPRELRHGLSMEIVAGTIASLCVLCKDDDATEMSIPRSTFVLAVQEAIES